MCYRHMHIHGRTSMEPHCFCVIKQHMNCLRTVNGLLFFQACRPIFSHVDGRIDETHAIQADEAVTILDLFSGDDGIGCKKWPHPMQCFAHIGVVQFSHLEASMRTPRHNIRRWFGIVIITGCKGAHQKTHQKNNSIN